MKTQFVINLNWTVDKTEVIPSNFFLDVARCLGDDSGVSVVDIGFCHFDFNYIKLKKRRRKKPKYRGIPMHV